MRFVGIWRSRRGCESWPIQRHPAPRMSDDIRGPLITAASAFFAVLIGTIVVPWIRDRIARKRAARYLAIRVVCVLDKYVDDCAAVATDWGEEDQKGFTQSSVSVPPIPVYPADLDWHSIDHSLMYRILSLPTASERANASIQGEAEYADPPDYRSFFEGRNLTYGQIGMKTYELAKLLRARYLIPDPEAGDWNPVDAMNREIKEIEELRQRRVAAMSGPPFDTQTE
jgi:hypothetical protein